CMFTFMNTARIGTAIQGVAHAEQSYQGSLPYAKERRSMRALSGKKEPDQVADALIHHGDVRRMLLTQKAVAEGGRAMVYFAAQY
ncbi:acyl-CoA dehydrogenase, partial [Acinetobacter baumannii]